MTFWCINDMFQLCVLCWYASFSVRSSHNRCSNYSLLHMWLMVLTADIWKPLRRQRNKMLKGKSERGWGGGGWKMSRWVSRWVRSWDVRARRKSAENDSRMRHVERRHKGEQTHCNLCTCFAFEIDIWHLSAACVFITVSTAGGDLPAKRPSCQHLWFV